MPVFNQNIRETLTAKTKYAAGLSLTLIDTLIRAPLITRLFLIIVAVPSFLAIVYYLLMASDIFIAEARFSVRSNNELPSIGMLDSMLGMGNSASSPGDDIYIVRDYILSRDMLYELDAKLDLKEHFQSGDIDIISRLASDATQEEFYEYYLNKIEVKIDLNASIATLKVRMFDAEFSQHVASRVIQKSEELINQMTNRIMEDTLKFARNEVAGSENLVRQASDEISRFRYTTNSIDPAQDISAVLEIIYKLEGELALAQAELNEAKIYMKQDSLQVKIAIAKVNALEQQVEKEKARLITDKGDKENYTQLIYKYEPLQLNKILAEKQYTSALTSLELARAEAQRKQRYLIAFVTPQIPDEAIEPKRSIKILTVFFASLLTYAIGGLVWAAIKDHMRN